MTNSVDDGFVLIDDEYDNEVENLEVKILTVIHNEPNRTATIVEALTYVFAFAIKDHPRADGIIEGANEKLKILVREMKDGEINTLARSFSIVSKCIADMKEENND